MRAWSIASVFVAACGPTATVFPLARTCGDGVVDVDLEECDDGPANGTTRCGCGPTCTFPTFAISCGNADRCKGVEACNGEGACVVASPPPVCDDDRPDTNDSCAPVSGCAHLGIAQTTETARYGNTAGGTLFTDTCPPNQVMIGFDAEVGASFDRIGVVCGVPVVNPMLGVDVVPGDVLPLRGATPNVPMTGSCGPGEMVIGFAGSAGGLLDNLVLRCAPISATYANNLYTVIPGAVTAQPGVGGSGGVAFPDTDCPGGIAIGANINAGGSVDAFGLICGAVSITQ